MDYMVIGILLVIIGIGAVSTVKHFKGKSGCCGGGSNYISKKKLKKIVETKTYLIEGMHCENCVARVLRYINDIEGVTGKINLKKKELLVSSERKINDDEIIAAVTKAGNQVIGNGR